MVRTWSCASRRGPKPDHVAQFIAQVTADLTVADPVGLLTGRQLVLGTDGCVAYRGLWAAANEPLRTVVDAVTAGREPERTQDRARLGPMTSALRGITVRERSGRPARSRSHRWVTHPRRILRRMPGKASCIAQAKPRPTIVGRGWKTKSIPNRVRPAPAGSTDHRPRIAASGYGEVLVSTSTA
jgi:hypothetical protein